MKLDILAIAAHPDDIELSCSGTLLHHLQLGKKVGILDLTKGQLGTRGNEDLRLKEAAAAAKILGISIRDNLGMMDGFFQNDKEHQLEIIKKLRHYRPDVVLANAISDRHPDHGRAAKLISESCFYSGLPKIKTGQDAWRPQAVYHYIQDRYLKPDLVIDVTGFVEKKFAAIKAFASQFNDPGSSEPQTPISSPEFLEFIRARMMDFGRLINVKYGEGFTVERAIGVGDMTILR